MAGESAEVYELGENVGLAVTFGTPEAPVDPARVVVRLMDPVGGVCELTYGVHEALVRTDPGRYQVVLEATIPGRWRYRFVGSGRAQGALDGFFDVFDLGAPG